MGCRSVASQKAFVEDSIIKKGCEHSIVHSDQKIQVEPKLINRNADTVLVKEIQRGRERVCSYIYVCICVCTSQSAVFNAVPEGFNPDYQEHKVTESLSA